MQTGKSGVYFLL